MGGGAKASKSRGPRLFPLLLQLYKPVASQKSRGGAWPRWHGPYRRLLKKHITALKQYVFKEIYTNFKITLNKYEAFNSDLNFDRFSASLCILTMDSKSCFLNYLVVHFTHRARHQLHETRYCSSHQWFVKLCTKLFPSCREHEMKIFLQVFRYRNDQKSFL